MNKFAMNLSKHPLIYLRIFLGVHKFYPVLNIPCYATSVDVLDAFTIDLVQKHRKNSRILDINRFSIRNFMQTEEETPDISKMSTDELDNVVLNHMTKTKDRTLVKLLADCTEAKKNISEITLKKLFRNYSQLGKADIVEALQKYCLIVDPCINQRNGDFMHYLAKAQCMKGNSDKGLSILTDCYEKNPGLRNFYRTIFRELIQDTVLNRSEASLVIFKKYVLEFSTTFNDHYPLICFWHLCWSSSWFSDQMLSNELLESSSNLQEIVRDKATAFSITILRQEYNEDAVVRLLQTLLKYKMIEEYSKVLQVLFSYKLRNKDIRGCQEIIRNCDVLGIALPSNQQGKYIKMLIDGKPSEMAPKPTKTFKLKW